MKHSEATLGARLVLLVLAEYAHEDGTDAYPKVETISGKARMSRKGVQSALRRLEVEGEIFCSGTSPYGTKIYLICGMQPGENSGDTGDTGAKMATEGGEDGDRRGEVTTPDPLDNPVKEPSIADRVREAWGKHAPPLIAHPETIFKSTRFKAALKTALKTYEPDAIVKAIENYAAIMQSREHYWNHRYSVVEFLNRPKAAPGVERFVDEAMPFVNFHAGRDRDRAGGQQHTPVAPLEAAEAWVLNTAWRLPLEEYEIAEQLGKRGVEGPDRTRLLDLWRQKKQLAA